MIFKKEEFDFLKSYNVVADSKSFLNDKLYINFSKDKGRVIFAQFSNKFNVITSLNKTIQDDNFSIVIETSQFNSLISLLPKESDINITEGKIIFGESAYELQKFDGDYSIAELFIDTIESVRKSKVTVNDLKKLVVMKTYAGVDDLETIALMDGKFLASNRTDITGVINTSNDISIEKFFPLEIANIIAFNSIDSIDLFNVKINDQDVSYFVIGSTYFLINEKDYSLENIFSDEIKEIYDHPYNVKINKDELIQALTRISVVARDNIYNRIFISFDTNNMIIESIDIGYSVEKVKFTTLSSEIQDVKFIISANNTKTILQSLPGKEVIVKILNDEDAIAISFIDEINDRFFIHTLYENIDD